NKTSATGTSLSVVAGSYTYSVSDGRWNRTEGTVVVSKNTSVSVELPYGEWFGEIKLLDQRNGKVPFEYTQDMATHTATYKVPDTADRVSIILNAMIGDVPDSNTTYLRAIYVDTNGVDRSHDVESWNSRASTLISLLEANMQGRTFDLEAQYATADNTTQIQSYTITVDRVPTLISLTASAENTVLPLEFDPQTYEYSITTVASPVTFSAQGFGSDYNISGTGNVTVKTTKTHKITVESGGNTSVYTINIKKVSSVNVTLSLPSGTTAEVFNAAQAKIEPVSGVYHLVPDEQYHVIGTKNVYYHTRKDFTASAGLTVSVSAPDTADALSALGLYSAAFANSASTRVHEIVPAFAPSQHDLSSRVSDVYTSVYAQATPENDYEVTANYISQSQQYFGEDRSILIERTVGARQANVLSSCIDAVGYAQPVTFRLSKDIDDVTYYQDYEVLMKRSTHLKTMTISDGTGNVTLFDGDKKVIKFNRDILEYYVSLDRAVKSVTLNATFNNTADYSELCGGYYAVINSQRYDAIEDYVMDLDDSLDEELLEIEVHHADSTSVTDTYKVHIQKTDPVAVTFDTDPSDATVFVKSNVSGKRVLPTGGVFMLIQGTDYTYTITRTGYVGIKVEEYVVPETADTVSVTLEQAAPSELTQLDSAWPSFRADDYNNGTISAKTPVTAEDTVLYWATKLGEGYSSEAVGCPIIVDGYIYTYSGTTLYKVDSISGQVVATGVMDRSSSFAINPPTYAEGILFVGLADGTIQAFNAETLESLWIYHDELAGQPDSPIMYRDGYIYTGFWLGETSTANYVCLSVTDEDPNDTLEEKLPTWTYSKKGGFYWVGSYVTDNYLLVCTDDEESGYTRGYGSLLSINPHTGELIDSLTMPNTGDLRSSVTFVPGASDTDGMCYFTSKGGYFYRAGVNSDGTFKPNSLRGLPLYNYESDSNNPPNEHQYTGSVQRQGIYRRLRRGSVYRILRTQHNGH
ncbi:MAG: PQQ-binding-like beta-propeller repeat protein, partial [Oscillospiraceae bacterium]|nr:PQQ-binding-like beta-propeller repeat protein [Oscillospiraceae bacterium]